MGNKTSPLVLMQNSLRRLSSEPEDQIAYLKALGVYPLADELALEFDDSYMALRAATQVDAKVSMDVMSMLDTLDGLLAQMSGSEKSELWNAGALDSAEWNKVRQLAGEILARTE